MVWKFADLKLDGREYSVSQAENGDTFVAVHFTRYMPGSVRWIRTARRVDANGKLGQKLTAIAQQQWSKA